MEPKETNPKKTPQADPQTNAQKNPQTNPQKDTDKTKPTTQPKAQDSSRLWHNMSAKEVVKTLGTDSTQGLCENDANARQKTYGLNELPEEEPLTGLRLFLEQFKSPLVYILVFAGIATLFLHEYTDTIVIFAAVGLNTTIGFFQENKASKALSELKKVLKVNAFVIRDGHEKEMLQEQLVPGDLIVLKPGFKVPADGRLIEAKELKVSEAALTGEWMASDKSTSLVAKDIPLADRENMVYMGTIIESGEGRAVVTSTGTATEIGKVATLVKETKEEKTPYQRKLADFSKIVGIIIALLCVFIFVEGMVTGGEFKEMFTTSIAVAVAAIPEGLPVAMTVILAVGMQRIMTRQGLVRKLASAETLGSTSVICTDKTGTLTEAKMRVSILVTGTKQILSKNWNYSEEIDKDSKTSHAQSLKIAASCSDAFIENPHDNIQDWVVRGRPTDRALLLAAAQAGIYKEDIETNTPKVSDLPFNSVAKYSATLNKLSKSDYMMYVLGAPEIILEMSRYIEMDGTQTELSREKLALMTKKYEDMTGSGMRVLATAYKKLGLNEFTKETQEPGEPQLAEEDMKELVFVGFIGLDDPVRSGVKEAMDTCKKAGMKAIVITGDNKLTAMSVAKKLGMHVKDKNMIEGRELDKLTDEEFEKRVAEIQIYARVEPAQKLRIVTALQAMGEVVAMTGDGINDAPALKRADIGVAVGSGTDVAKEVSDLLLLKDDFSVIVAAVEEGRVIIDNIRKVITYLLSDSFTEVVLIGGSIIAGFPLPLTAAQILWVNLIEDGLPNIALTFEPKEEDVMQKKPERHDAPLLTKEMKTIIFLIGLITDVLLLFLFFYLLNLEHDIVHVRTMIFAALTIDSLFYVFSCKSLRKSLWHINVFSNMILVAAVAFGAVMLVLAIYVPALQLLLKTVPLNAGDWLIILGLGALELTLVEVTKWHFISRHEAT